MTKLIKKYVLLLFSLFFLLSCNSEENCAPDYLSKLQEIKGQYKDLYAVLSTDENQKQLIDSLEFFLKDYRGLTCTEGEFVHNPTGEVVNLLNDLKNKISNKENRIIFSNKVIYGDDNRVDVDQSSNEVFKTLAKSTAAMIRNNKINSNFELPRQSLGEALNLCSDQRFRDQIGPASCSGFLVSRNLMVTAGHCIQSQRDCDNHKWVFGFDKSDIQLDPSQIYSCKKVIKRKFEPKGIDYAVFEINRDVLDRAPLKFRERGEIGKNQNIVVIGHPSGLPTKIADGAVVRDQSNPGFFVTNLDAFGGNSGSPVFNVETGLVEGVLVRGEADYTTVNENGKSCRKVNKCTETGCRGEEVTKITSVDGLPLNSTPLEMEAFKDIFERRAILTSMGGELPYFAVRYKGFLLGGRKFLDLCGAQVSSASNPKVWSSHFLGDCQKDGNDLSQIYKDFKRLVN